MTDAWRLVTLPHDWSVEHPFDLCNASGTGYLPGGTAWYRKHFTMPESVTGQRVRITFNGVYKHARVWINSNYLGERPYGYATFTHDITAFVRPGENVLCVRVEHNEVADSRWFTGSGIYRDVLLEISDPICFAVDGIFACTLCLPTRKKPRISIRYETLGGDGAAFSLTDPSGREVAAGQALGETGEIQLDRLSASALVAGYARAVQTDRFRSEERPSNRRCGMCVSACELSASTATQVST